MVFSTRSLIDAELVEAGTGATVPNVPVRVGGLTLNDNRPQRVLHLSRPRAGTPGARRRET